MKELITLFETAGMFLVSCSVIVLKYVSIVIVVSFFISTDTSARPFLRAFEPASEEQIRRLIKDGLVSEDESVFLKHLTYSPLEIFRIESPKRCYKDICWGIIYLPDESGVKYIELPVAGYVFVPDSFSLDDDGTQITFMDEAGCTQASLTYVWSGNIRVHEVGLEAHCD